MTAPNGHANDHVTATSGPPRSYGSARHRPVHGGKSQRGGGSVGSAFSSLPDRVEGHKHNQESEARPRPGDSVCRPASLYRSVECTVLAHMQSAERGLRRAEAARDKAELAAFAAVLQRLKLRSLDQVDNLKTLQEIVVALEGAAARDKQ